MAIPFPIINFFFSISADEDEISFDPDEIITNIEMVRNSSWKSMFTFI